MTGREVGNVVDLYRVRDGAPAKFTPLKRDAGETGRQPCVSPSCDHASLAGFVHGQGRCAYHWSEMNWGRKWADQCYPERAS